MPGHPRARALTAYALAVGLFGLGLGAILEAGSGLSTGGPAVTAAKAPAPTSSRSPLALFLLQAIVIVAASRCFARAARSVGQPEVVGEIAAGICLGPSLLGLLWPASQSLLFPAASLGALQSLSQGGLVLFMFIVGMEINPDLLREKAQEALLISHASIILPFLLGTGLSLGLYRDYAPAGVLFAPFALFMGAAMSVTAFPVLARIIHERGLSRSAIGTLALSCAAVDDVTAWCALAAVVGITRSGSAAHAIPVAGLCLVFVAFMAFVARPALAAWMARRGGAETLGKEAAAAAVLTAFAAALLTEWIGVHALFGAFVAGVFMPRELAFRQALVVKFELFTTLLLLPLFFALTGLRTEVGLLGSRSAWLACAAVIVTAVTGKLAGSSLAARWAGLPWRESLAIGTLMNARGLIELVVLNVGYDLGVITPAVFTMMVIMALVTTVMTGPLLARFISFGAEPADRERLKA